MRQAAREHPVIACLVLVPIVMYLASMACPVDRGWDDGFYGWMAAWICLASSCASLWETVTQFTPIPDGATVYFAGNLANVAFLTVTLLGWTLRGRPGTVAFLFGGVLATALAIPPLMALWPVFGSTPGWSGLSSLVVLETYREWQIGYWLWTASFAGAMLVWAGLCWRQRRAARIEPATEAIA